MKPVGYEVLNLIVRFPGRRYSELWFFSRHVTRSQWYYWTRKLERMGMVLRKEHGHNQHNRWDGFKVTEKGHEVYLAIHAEDIPF